MKYKPETYDHNIKYPLGRRMFIWNNDDGCIQHSGPHFNQSLGKKGNMNFADNDAKQKWKRRQIWGMINKRSQYIFHFKNFNLWFSI